MDGSNDNAPNAGNASSTENASSTGNASSARNAPSRNASNTRNASSRNAASTGNVPNSNAPSTGNSPINENATNTGNAATDDSPLGLVPAAIDLEFPTSSGTVPPVTVMRLTDTVPTDIFNSLSAQPSTYTMPSIGSFCCRICQQGNEVEVLVSPCDCKGTLAYVHLSCLQRWLNIIGRSYCEICLYRFNTIERRRYSVFRALRLWFCHPANRQSLQCNLLRTSLLTFFVFSILTVIVFGMQVILRDSARFGLSDGWMIGVTGFFVGTIIIMYMMTVYLFMKGELTPWYRWWQRCVSVEIVLDKKPLVKVAKLDSR